MICLLFSFENEHLDHIGVAIIIYFDEYFLAAFLCSYDKGGHLFLPSYAMRTHGVRQQQDALRNVPRNQLKEVFKVNCRSVTFFFSCFIKNSAASDKDVNNLIHTE